MKTSLLTIVLLAVVAPGCASTQTVKEAKGQGVSQTYPYAYDPVYDATISAAKAKKLDVVETDKANGQLVLSHGITLLSWGERIAVFVKPIAAGSTEVEIISKPVLSPLNFPPDWQRILFDQIDTELRSAKNL
jgi:hypothetical protein